MTLQAQPMTARGESSACCGMAVLGACGVGNATNTWWGAGGGPSGVGAGSGDGATTNVNFSPFLAAPNPAAGARDGTISAAAAEYGRADGAKQFALYALRRRSIRMVEAESVF